MDSVRVLSLVAVTLAALLGPIVHGYGITATAPRGWHVRIVPGALRATAPGFSLALYEDPPDPSGIYHHGYPSPFVRSSFGAPDGYATSPNGHGFARRNFTVAGRYFSLFVQARSFHPAHAAIARLNAFVRTLRIARGDFFPGVAPPARFRPAPGWHTRHSPTGPDGPETYSTTTASTVPYRDCLNCFPPHETVAHLPADGIVVFLSLDASDRRPPTETGQPSSLRLAPQTCGPFEGIPEVATCAVHAQVLGQYDVDGWVVFGRANPTETQIARARAELDRLVMPVWPRWR